MKSSDKGKLNTVKFGQDGASKHLEGKLPYYLIPKEALDAISLGLQCGIRKGYERHDWKKGMPIMEGALAAVVRHIFKYAAGEDYNVEIDEDGNEFKTHHLDNAMAGLAMAVTLIKQGRIDLDDR